MKKITFIMPELGTGGAEKMIFNLLRLLPPEDYDISVVLFLKKGFLVDQLPSHVRVTTYSNKRLLLAIPTLWKTLRSSSDYFFCSGYHNSLMAILAYIQGASEKLILRETSIVSVAKSTRTLTYLSRFFNAITYDNCNSIIFQSEFGASEFRAFFGLNSLKSRVLHNFSDSPKRDSLMPERKSIFLVGTLNKNKDYITALEAISKVDSKHLIIEIFGDGPERKNLEEYSDRILSSYKVIFHGYVNGMEKHWERALVHLMTSKSESFPNVIVEAALSGVPSVCLRAPGGITEMFQMSNWGSLVTNKSDLSIELCRLMNIGESDRTELSNNAIKYFLELPRKKYLEFFRKL